MRKIKIIVTLHKFTAYYIIFVMGFWKTFAACLLAIVTSSIVSFFISIFIFVAIIAAIGSSTEDQPYTMKPKSVLVVDFADPIVETTDGNLLNMIDFASMEITHSITCYDVVRMIKNAAIEPSIKGIYLKFPLTPAASPTTMYELREALAEFRRVSPEKFVVAYSDGYSQVALYLSSVATSVYLNPAGGIEWQGLSMTSMFYKGTLDKLGVTPEIIRNGKFKGAVEPFMLDKMSDENREQLTSIISSSWNYLLGQIASARSLDTAMLNNAATNLSILTAMDAAKIGLVDKVLYADQVEDELKALSGADADDNHCNCNYLSLREYRRSGGLGKENSASKNHVEVIYAVGEIVDQGKNEQQIVGSELAKKIAKARKCDDVKAIVLRVNSPGGSALASDLIWREMELAKAVKPVVVSMGTYAASGGYWISAPATTIVSSPLTITGSIGVFGLLFNAEKGMKDHLGLTFDVVKTNHSADLGSFVRPMSALERHYIQSSVDTIYQNFLTKVAAGRSMNRDSVDMIGQGRVWTGLQGKELGLVDEIGTLTRAIELAAIEAKIENDYKVTINGGVKKSFFEMFVDLSGTTAAKILGLTVNPVEMALEKLKAEQGTIKAIYPFVHNTVNN